MKRKILRLLLVFLLASMAPLSFGQIFMIEDDNQRTGTTSSEVEVIIPIHGVEYDQTNYTPIGGGALLLGGMAVGYLALRKKKKCD